MSWNRDLDLDPEHEHEHELQECDVTCGPTPPPCTLDLDGTGLRFEMASLARLYQSSFESRPNTTLALANAALSASAMASLS